MALGSAWVLLVFFVVACAQLPLRRCQEVACSTPEEEQEEGACLKGEALLQRGSGRTPISALTEEEEVKGEVNEGKEDEQVEASSKGGASWTEEEALIVMTKLHKFLQDPTYHAKIAGLSANFECYAESEESNSTKLSVVPCDHWGKKDMVRTWLPTFAMMLRLGFHGCMKYKDGSGGCDGCMNFKSMFMTWGPKPVKRWTLSRPSELAGVSANLAMLADALEKIYTETDFPRWAPKLKKSLQASGKSRADLWAFAALIGMQEGMRRNNEDCKKGEVLYSVMDVGVPCEIKLSRPIAFYTGRSDCAEAEQPKLWSCDASCTADGETFTDPKCTTKHCTWPAVCKTSACRGCAFCMARDGSHKPRVYETLLEEDGPSMNFNGSRVADYFHRTFGMSKRETIALMGAHSFGKVRGEASGGFRYDWTHKQTDQLNSVYYRVISIMPSKHFQKGSMWGVSFPATTVGGVRGDMTESRMFLHVDGKEVGGGHYQWFHGYLRCPFCYEGQNLDRHRNAYSSPQNRCCELCEKAKSATLLSEKPFKYKIKGLTKKEKKEFEERTCLRWSNVHETEFTVDVALHRMINVAEGGRPLDKNMKNIAIMRDDDPLNELQDDGDLKMHQIVEQYAKDQNLWADEFVLAVEKMLANGVKAPLHKSFEIDLNIACTQPEKRSHEMELCKVE